MHSVAGWLPGRRVARAETITRTTVYGVALLRTRVSLHRGSGGREFAMCTCAKFVRSGHQIRSFWTLMYCTQARVWHPIVLLYLHPLSPQWIPAEYHSGYCSADYTKNENYRPESFMK